MQTTLNEHYWKSILGIFAIVKAPSAENKVRLQQGANCKMTPYALWPLQGRSVQRQTGLPEASHPLNPRSKITTFFIPISSSVSARKFASMRAHDGPRTYKNTPPFNGCQLQWLENVTFHRSVKHLAKA